METVFAQDGLHTLFELDVILVDDASSQFSPDDAHRSLGAAPVRYVRHEVNRGSPLRLTRGSASRAMSMLLF
jgi:hypothetical protein